MASVLTTSGRAAHNKIAPVAYRATPQRREVARVPDYYLEETDAWLMYPHSLEGLTLEEIKAHRPALYDIVKDRIAATQPAIKS